jgi:hypothetical protein
LNCNFNNNFNLNNKYTIVIFDDKFIKIMRSFENNRHVESSSFWDQLENDIDKMGNRARDKLMKYEIKQFQTIKNNNP